MKNFYFIIYFILKYEFHSKFMINKLILSYLNKIILKLLQYSRIKNMAIYNV